LPSSHLSKECRKLEKRVKNKNTVLSTQGGRSDDAATAARSMTEIERSLMKTHTTGKSQKAHRMREEDADRKKAAKRGFLLVFSSTVVG
jgi:hypothetical protein